MRNVKSNLCVKGILTESNQYIQKPNSKGKQRVIAKKIGYVLENIITNEIIYVTDKQAKYIAEKIGYKNAYLREQKICTKNTRNSIKNSVSLQPISFDYSFSHKENVTSLYVLDENQKVVQPLQVAIPLEQCTTELCRYIDFQLSNHNTEPKNINLLSNFLGGLL